MALLIHENTWHQWTGQRVLDKTINIQVWGFGVPYIRDFTVYIFPVPQTNFSTTGVNVRSLKMQTPHVLKFGLLDKRGWGTEVILIQYGGQIYPGSFTFSKPFESWNCQQTMQENKLKLKRHHFYEIYINGCTGSGQNEKISSKWQAIPFQCIYVTGTGTHWWEIFQWGNAERQFSILFYSLCGM